MQLVVPNNQKRFYIYSQAFTSLMGGILFLSLEVKTVLSCLHPFIGGTFLLVALFLVISPCLDSLLSIAERLLSIIWVALWIIIVLSIMLLYYQALDTTSYDNWRFKAIIWSVPIFFILLIISLVLCPQSSIPKGMQAIIGWIRRGHNWLWLVSFAIVVLVYLLWYFGCFTKVSGILNKMASWPWLTIGTWFTGIALATFAGLTWKVSNKQQKIELYPDLECRMSYQYPKCGQMVFEGKAKYYHGIKWEVEATNPGAVPVEVRKFEFGIENTGTLKKTVITGLPGHMIFDAEQNPISERGFFIRPKDVKRFILVIFDDNIEMELSELVGIDNRNLRLFFELTWISRGKEQHRILESMDFYLPQNPNFRQENKPAY